MTTNEITHKIEDVVTNVTIQIRHKLQIFGFWTIILFGVGCFAGMTYYNKTKANDMAEAIKIGGFIYDSKVYDIKLRPVQ